MTSERRGRSERIRSAIRRGRERAGSALRRDRKSADPAVEREREAERALQREREAERALQREREAERERKRSKSSASLGRSRREPLGPPRSKPSRRRPRGGFRSNRIYAAIRLAVETVWAGLTEIGRFWLRIAERLGNAELWVLRKFRRPALAVAGAVKRAYAWARAEITPERTFAAVIVAAAVLIAVSQFVDYRGVRVGAPQYQGVQSVAPAPEVSRRVTGSAHAYVLLPAALAAIGAALWCLRGSGRSGWRLGQLVAAIGLFGIGVSFVVDAPKGLREGSAGIAFEGAHAVLLGGFWVQLTASAVLVVTGLLLARSVRDQAGAGARGRIGSRPMAGARA